MSPTACVFLGVMLMSTHAAPSRVEYLSDVRERILDAHQDWDLLGFDVTTHQPHHTPLPLRIKDKTYARGLGTHANSEIIVGLDGEYEAFEAEVGLVWEDNSVGAVIFQVYVDGVDSFDSGVMHATDPARPVHVSLQGAQELRLTVRLARQDITCCGANWADARLTRDPKVPPRAAQVPMDMAPFARVVTCDPARTDGARSGRLEEYRAEDVFLEWEIAAKRGVYDVPTYAQRVAKGGSPGLGCIGLQWPERRFLSELSLDFAPGVAMPPSKSVRVEYWSAGGVEDDNWSTTAETLWQGLWAPTPGMMEEQPGRLVFHIGDVPEFANRGGIHKIRWILPASPARVGPRASSSFASTSPSPTSGRASRCTTATSTRATVLPRRRAGTSPSLSASSSATRRPRACPTARSSASICPADGASPSRSMTC